MTGWDSSAHVLARRGVDRLAREINGAGEPRCARCRADERAGPPGGGFGTRGRDQRRAHARRGSRHSYRRRNVTRATRNETNYGLITPTDSLRVHDYG